jgi:hypothetical protein
MRRLAQGGAKLQERLHRRDEFDNEFDIIVSEGVRRPGRQDARDGQGVGVVHSSQPIVEHPLLALKV